MTDIKRDLTQEWDRFYLHYVPIVDVEEEPVAADLFFGLSRWAEDWIRNSSFWQMDPENLKKGQVSSMAGLVRQSSSLIDDLGQYGPIFCAACRDYDIQLSAIAAPVGPVTSNLAYMMDWFALTEHKALPEQSWPHAHAAIAEWMGKIGELVFTNWMNAVDERSCFLGPYFTEENIVDSSEMLASYLIDACWNSKAAGPVFARMGQERSRIFLDGIPTADSLPPAPKQHITKTTPSKGPRRRSAYQEVVDAFDAGCRKDKDVISFVRSKRNDGSEPSPKLIAEVRRQKLSTNREDNASVSSDTA